MKNKNLNPAKGQSNKTQTTLMNKMDAIAYGVQARFEESTGYIEKVTDETINIARSLGVTSTEIERWANHRRASLADKTAKLKSMKSLLHREQSLHMVS